MDRRRIDVDESLPPVTIPGAILHELYRHAQETFPEECCGLILGDDAERYRQLVRCRNEMSKRHDEDPVAFPHDGHSAFYMSPVDHQQAVEQAEAAGERVTAVYHSHVGAGAYLSEIDLEYAESRIFPFPDADQIVVAVVEARVDGAALFRREGIGRPFLGRRVAWAAA